MRSRTLIDEGNNYMNNLTHLVYSVKDDTHKVMKDLAAFTGLKVNTIRCHMQQPGKKMFVDDAIRIRNFFRQHFPCEIDDLIQTDDPGILRKKGFVKISEVNAPQKPGRRVRGRNSTRATATA